MDGQDGTPSKEIPPVVAADRPAAPLVAADLPPEPAPPPLTASTGRLDLDDGGWMRYGIWRPDGPPRGSLVLLNGRAEYLEKYEAVARSWAARGFLVFGMDWRGQGLSSRFLPDGTPQQASLRQRGYLRDYAVLLADLDVFLERVVLAQAVPPLVLFGHSMGGHLALRHLLDRGSGPFAAAVLSAPMTDIRNRPRWVSPALARIAARSAVLSGCGTAYVPGQRDYDPAREAFRTNPVTSDPEIWAVHHRWYRAVPDLVLGGVTFAWLDASFRSIDRLRRPGPEGRIELPMLVMVPGRDCLVPPESQAALGARHAHCRIVRHEDALHEILMEREEIRRRAWADIDAFLAEVLAEREPAAVPA
jgi:lysophospholipase